MFAASRSSSGRPLFFHNNTSNVNGNSNTNHTSNDNSNNSNNVYNVYNIASRSSSGKPLFFSGFVYSSGDSHSNSRSIGHSHSQS